MTCFGQKWADLGSYAHPYQSTGAPGASGPSKSSPKGHPLIRPTHSHVDLCPSIMLEAGGLGCAAQWGCSCVGCASASCAVAVTPLFCRILERSYLAGTCLSWYHSRRKGTEHHMLSARWYYSALSNDWGTAVFGERESSVLSACGLQGCEENAPSSALRLGKLRSRGSNTGEGQSISWSVCARCS